MSITCDINLGRGGLMASRLCVHALILLLLGPSFTGYTLSSAEEVIEAFYPSTPHFDSGQHTHLTAVVGQTVYLPCTVYNLTDKLVSWIRTRDLNILTHGTATFTADPRFDMQHQDTSWNLKIRSVRRNDTGKYECQVNTDPKMSLFFDLEVREHVTPTYKALLSGPKEQYVTRGSTVTFVCDVTSEGQEARAFRQARPVSVHWLHNGLAVSFQASRGGISIDTTRSDAAITSRLTVADVDDNDGGKYTCGAGDAADSLILHVLERDEYGEQMEAMQRDQASSGAERFAHCDTTFICALIVAMAMLL